jgi:hypothetical protein
MVFGEAETVILPGNLHPSAKKVVSGRKISRSSAGRFNSSQLSPGVPECGFGETGVEIVLELTEIGNQAFFVKLAFGFQSVYNQAAERRRFTTVVFHTILRRTGYYHRAR